MDRGSSAEPLSWLVVPSAAVLVASALTLPLQPYTGVALRGGEVMSVDRGSPGAAAGLTVEGVFFLTERWDYDAETRLYRTSQDYEIWTTGDES